MDNTFFRSTLDEKNEIILAQSKYIEKLENQKPPMITLDEASGFKFERGEAGIKDKKFILALEGQIFNALENIIQNKNYGNLNVIEIIGHTDGTSVLVEQKGCRSDPIPSKFDKDMEKYIKQEKQPDELEYTSNAGLGLAGALTVMELLKKKAKESNRLKGIEFHAYSAAQLYPPDENIRYKRDDGRRRRIEIRCSKKNIKLDMKLQKQ